jgi:hypothetical protein
LLSKQRHTTIQVSSISHVHNMSFVPTAAACQCMPQLEDNKTMAAVTEATITVCSLLIWCLESVAAMHACLKRTK